MKDFIESASTLLHEHLGVYVPPGTLNLLVVSLTSISIFWVVQRQIRLRMGDRGALPTEMRATADVIAETTRDGLNALLKDFRSLHTKMERSVASRFDAIHHLLSTTKEVESTPDSEVKDEASKNSQDKNTRVHQAHSIASTVTDQWLSGRQLAPLGDEPHRYGCEGNLESGQGFKLIFGTPYRNLGEPDGRLPFTLDIWIDRKKHLNYEWDLDGNFALRGFKRGDGVWLSQLAEWQVRIHARNRGVSAA